MHCNQARNQGGGNRAIAPHKFSKTCLVLRYNSLLFCPNPRKYLCGHDGTSKPLVGY